MLLDAKNPRIPPTGELLNQRALIAELVAHDKVYDLARNIVQNGYYPVESLIAVKEDGNLVVVEGNRRLAALKLLIAPESAPDDDVAKFRALSNRIDKATIKRVKVVIAPDRQATAPVVMSRHTDVQVERWDPIMQASYYSSLLQNGLSIEDLSRQYNLQRRDVVQSTRLYKMYQLACSLDLPDQVKSVVHNPREFKATNLQRFYERPASQRFLGISLSSDVPDVIGNIDKDEFLKGYTRIVSDVATGTIDSRVIGTTEQVAEYIARIPTAEAPNLANKGTFTVDSLLTGAKAKKGKSAKKPGAVTKKPRPKPTGLIPGNISCEVNSQRIGEIFNELKTIPVSKYPNATAVLLRSLLEMALCHHLRGSGDLEIIINAEKERLQKQGRAIETAWLPSLKRMMTHIVGKDCHIMANNPPQLRVLKRFISQRDELFSHDSLNFFVHNQYFPPNEDALRGFWGQLEGLFQVILVEPNPA